MEKLTGIVMEKQHNSIVVLTDRGEFRKVRVTGRMPEIGEEVTVPVRTGRTWAMPRLGAIAVAAAVLLFMLVSPLAWQWNQRAPETAAAWVTIDIDPSIELTVSNRLKVMEARAVNKEGERILKLIDFKGMKVEQAVNEITSKAMKLGYIGKVRDNTVLLSFTYKPASEIDKTKLQKTLLASAQEALESDAAGGTVQSVNVPPEVREKAVEKKITAGKYAVLIEAVTKHNLNLTEKDMQEKSISKAIADAGGQVEVVLAKAHEEKDFDQKEKTYLKIASVKPSEVAVAIKPADGENPAADKAGNEQGADNRKTTGEHRFVSKIRDGKDPEATVAETTYKNNGGSNNATGNNTGNATGTGSGTGTGTGTGSATGTGDNRLNPVRPGTDVNETKPPAQPETGVAQPPSRGGLQQGSGNYVVPQPPVDDRGMYLLKPNF